MRGFVAPNRWRDRVELYKTVSTNRDGRFNLTGIAPGDYKLFAWEAIEPYSWFDPEVIRRFESNNPSDKHTATEPESRRRRLA